MALLQGVSADVIVAVVLGDHVFLLDVMVTVVQDDHVFLLDVMVTFVLGDHVFLLAKRTASTKLLLNFILCSASDCNRAAGGSLRRETSFEGASWRSGLVSRASHTDPPKCNA